MTNQHRYDPTEANAVLPNEPGDYGEPVDVFKDGNLIRTRWLPGAFGDDITTIEGVWAYKIEDDEWEDNRETDGTFHRTLTRATILERA
jgi:hypothetical protein